MIKLNVNGLIFEINDEIRNNLINKSDYFRALFQDGFKESNQEEIKIDYDSTQFFYVMQYLDNKILINSKLYPDLEFFGINIPKRDFIYLYENRYLGGFEFSKKCNIIYTKLIKDNKIIFNYTLNSDMKLFLYLKDQKDIMSSCIDDRKIPNITYDHQCQFKHIQNSFIRQYNSLHTNKYIKKIRNGYNIYEIPNIPLDTSKGAGNLEIELYDDEKNKYEGYLFIEYFKVQEYSNIYYKEKYKWDSFNRTYTISSGCENMTININPIGQGKDFILTDLCFEIEDLCYEILSLSVFDGNNILLSIPGFLILEQMYKLGLNCKIHSENNIDKRKIYKWSFNIPKDIYSGIFINDLNVKIQLSPINRNRKINITGQIFYNFNI